MNKPDWFQEKKTFYSFKNLLHLRNLQGLCLKALIFSLFFTLVTLDVLNFDVFVALMKIYWVSATYTYWASVGKAGWPSPDSWVLIAVTHPVFQMRNLRPRGMSRGPGSRRVRSRPTDWVQCSEPRLQTACPSLLPSTALPLPTACLGRWIEPGGLNNRAKKSVGS